MAKATVREVKILDAVLKEDEGTEDDPKIVQYIWLQLQDVKSERVYTAVLSLEDIKDLTKIDTVCDLLVISSKVGLLGIFTNESSPLNLKKDLFLPS